MVSPGGDSLATSRSRSAARYSRPRRRDLYAIASETRCPWVLPSTPGNAFRFFFGGLGASTGRLSFRAVDLLAMSTTVQTPLSSCLTNGLVEKTNRFVLFL